MAPPPLLDFVLSVVLIIHVQEKKKKTFLTDYQVFKVTLAEKGAI